MPASFSHTLVVRPQHQPDSKPFSFPTTRAGFDDAVAFIRRQVPGTPAETILVGIEFAGNYGFTFGHYLAQLGFPIVSVLPAHTKRWKDVAHNQPLKTDAKDASSCPSWARTRTLLIQRGPDNGLNLSNLQYSLRARVTRC